jgi:lipid-binding SYLF domain-containing protein
VFRAPDGSTDEGEAILMSRVAARARATSGVALPTILCVLAVGAAIPAAAPRSAVAASAAEIDRKVTDALRDLQATNEAARVLSKRAKAILVFPSMVKAGFMFGGQIGEGALRESGRTVAYYNSVAASYGFQAGVQTFGYALFFMNDAALRQFRQTKGFEVGVGPSLVIVDEGVARTITTGTLTSDLYAFVFGQKGLMAGVGIQGSKITRVEK